MGFKAFEADRFSCAGVLAGERNVTPTCWAAGDVTPPASGFPSALWLNGQEWAVPAPPFMA